MIKRLCHYVLLGIGYTAFGILAIGLLYGLLKGLGDWRGIGGVGIGLFVLVAMLYAAAHTDSY